MSSAYLDKLDVSCNWKPSAEKNIKDTITFGNINDVDIESELTNLVSLESCVQLHSPGSSSPSPELSFTFVSDLAISAIKIVSEARIIELYGKGGEYMSTTHSDFLDDFEGMAVYTAFIKLTSPSPECSIKFKKLKNQDNVWLYGMGISVQPCQDLNHDGSQVDFKSVNDRLMQSGCDLTGNAEQCWKLLHTFQTFSSSERKLHPNLGSVDGSMPQSFGNTATYKKMCDLLLSISPKLSGSRSISQGSSSSFMPSSASSYNSQDPDNLNPENQFSRPVSSVNDEIKALITEQFQKLENNLIVKVDERLKKIEEKMDMMLLTLKTQTVSLDSKM